MVAMETVAREIFLLEQKQLNEGIFLNIRRESLSEVRTGLHEDIG